MSISMPRSIVRRDGRAPLQEPEEIMGPASTVPRRASRLRLLKTPRETDEVDSEKKRNSSRPDPDDRKENRRSPTRQPLYRCVHCLMLVGFFPTRRISD